LTSNASLQKVFHSFRLIEKIQDRKFKKENQKEKKKFPAEKIKLLEEIQSNFPEYIYQKILGKFYKAINYKHQKLTSMSW